VPRLPPTSTATCKTAKANGPPPYDYLRRVFTELPKAERLEDFEALLPYPLVPLDA
jgi:hypothetical protein